MRAVLWLFGLLVVLGGAAWFAVWTFDAPGPLPAPRAIVVPRGGLDQVADALVADGLVRNSLALQAAATVTRLQGPIRAGELEFPANASLRQVLAVLRTGRPVQHRLTIPEGLTAAQIVLLIDRAPALEGDTPLPPEGRLLPETYAYELGSTRAALVERARAAMDRALERSWAARSATLPLDTPQDVLTLASIVERETSKAEERPRVAAVFLNRLIRGMRLQSDPTVVYGVSNGLGVLDHGLTRAELDRDDPYNTYRIPGLPPGPIAMPGAASLRAVTQPAQTDELFFVADGTGGHAFARTNEEHQRNVARWREIERARAPRP
ncbi:MAG: endolytic transglycosylase MltG [Gemmatimonadaceae bacterium]|nr:endolytic transglycosylase MltG [Acetobacteraceae bacterium]